MSSTQDIDGRRVRAAKNQSLLREVNDRIEDLTAGEPASMFGELRLRKELDLACECTDETCTERITMTVAEYEGIRSESTLFFVRPGHYLLDVEEVVREEPAYFVVRKLGAGGAVAEKLDPRKRTRSR